MHLEDEATTFDCTAQSKGQQELMAVGCVSGELKIINKFGKTEKSFSAHKGAITSIKWSNDGQTIASAGEEGTVKVALSSPRSGRRTDSSGPSC